MNSGLQEITVAECMGDNGWLRYRRSLYVPDSDELRLRVIQEHQDTALAGHLGRAKTFDLIDRRYHWKGLRKDFDRYVRNCHDCQRSQNYRHSTFGVLRPLSVPDQPWEDISIDVIVGLPECKGFDAIWVVVDQLSKM